MYGDDNVEKRVTFITVIKKIAFICKGSHFLIEWMVQKVPHRKSVSNTSPQKEMLEYLYNGMQMSVHSRPSIQYQDGMELRDRKMTKDCTQPLRIGNIRALNGCAGRLF